MKTQNIFVKGIGYLSLALSLAILASFAIPQAHAQTAAPATVPPKRGTVKALAGNTIALLTDAPSSETVTITVPDTAKVQQLAVGSTDLKTATAGQFSDIAVGDRVLASVKAGDSPTSFTAARVILMKSGDIAQKNAADQADWKKNGIGGIVSAIDPTSGAITVTSGAKKVIVSTSATTTFRRFSGDSVKYEDARPGTAAQVHAGDQIEARGAKSDDGLTVQAAEVVSGSFKNLSGLITSIDPATGKITLKDLASKKVMTITVTPNSDVRAMPPQMAQMFAARAQGGAQAGGGGRGGGGGAAAASADAGGSRRSAGADLSQMIPRMPTATLAELKNGDAVMVVASEAAPGAATVTAVTLLSGVEPILTANPNGGMNLSGWSMGGGGGGGE